MNTQIRISLALAFGLLLASAGPAAAFKYCCEAGGYSIFDCDGGGEFRILSGQATVAAVKEGCCEASALVGTGLAGLDSPAAELERASEVLGMLAAGLAGSDNEGPFAPVVDAFDAVKVGIAGGSVDPEAIADDVAMIVSETRALADAGAFPGADGEAAEFVVLTARIVRFLADRAMLDAHVFAAVPMEDLGPAEQGILDGDGLIAGDQLDAGLDAYRAALAFARGLQQ